MFRDAGVVRFWCINVLPHPNERTLPQTFTVPASASRVLHSLAAPYRHTHRLLDVQRRRSSQGTSCARMVLASRTDQASHLTIHAMFVALVPPS
jgi:hypothetical protein